MTLNWRPMRRASIYGTALRGYFETPWTFEGTVRRLTNVSHQDPEQAAAADDKLTVLFIGRFGGHVFTLYDYKGDGRLHIGGHAGLPVVDLHAALLAACRRDS